MNNTLIEDKKSKAREYAKKHYQANKEKYRLKNAKWLASNKTKSRRLINNWYKLNKLKHNQASKDNYQKNKVKRNAQTRAWYQANKVRAKDIINRWHKKKYKTDPLFRCKCKIRNLISGAFYRKGYKKNGRTEKILDCTFMQLKIHIESQFKEGMNWFNHGTWHIDHRIPIASALTVEDVIKLNHYTNLQPLWAPINIKKGSKLE